MMRGRGLPSRVVAWERPSRASIELHGVDGTPIPEIVA
jgi:hypothetical protein